jgi:hypothetical protein
MPNQYRTLRDNGQVYFCTFPGNSNEAFRLLQMRFVVTNGIVFLFQRRLGKCDVLKDRFAV